MIEADGDVFYIVPTQWHSVAGANIAAAPVLSTPITLKGQDLTALDTLKAILGQVSAASGFKVNLGIMPIGQLATPHVAIIASNEPANDVLSRLLASIVSRPAIPTASVPAAMSYQMLFDPKQRFYAFNIHVVPNPNAKATATAIQPPFIPPNPSRGFKKSSK